MQMTSLDDADQRVREWGVKTQLYILHDGVYITLQGMFAGGISIFREEQKYIKRDGGCVCVCV